ncbi:50S ribosomal protein L28 [Buchnera aphidicola (Formosaphis micheliae)]|uniref:50S ribosomal protein L28 n=1 Tax=Buchnera aphidicola TaxID=9 RepID=UPI0031B80563
MSKICQITGKKIMVGNYRSHAMNATKRKFLPNLHFHRFWIPEEKRFIILRVSTKGMRLIDKKGIYTVLQEINKKNRDKIWQKTIEKK